MSKCPKCGAGLEIRLASRSSSESSESADISDLSQLLSAIDEDALEGGEQEFVTKTKERFDKYGANTRMSPKQMAWLHKIADKAGF